MKVEEIKEKYKDKWILLKVLSADEIDQLIEGKVIAHSKIRDEIYKEQRKVKGDIALFYTGEIPKEGYAVAFYG